MRQNFAWKISEELLKREIPDGVKVKPDVKPAGGDNQSGTIIEILRKQLDIKDQQIATQNDVIKGLSERVREGNILMGSLQQQLSLTEGRSKPSEVNVNVSESPKQGTDDGNSSKKTHWLFRKLF